MKNRIELLSPAGNLAKLKIAILYGADAVYIGGEKFSLRARANNFTLEDIKEGVKFAHKHNAKVYVTMNVLPHNNDLSGLKEYLEYLDSVHVDAIIASSMVIIDTALKTFKHTEVHASTQLSTLNSYACNYYQDLGIKRLVLGRECSISEINKIRRNTNVELEVFIHGGMCSSFSGRCMLSNHMVNRDANRGGCAHSCRWNYDLYQNDAKLNKDIYYNIGSKDLMALKELPRLIGAGVNSLKVEGRMKSEYYIACVIRAYRMLIDDYYKGIELDFDKYFYEINKAENRLTSCGFLNGNVTFNEQLYDRDDHPTKEFLGMVIDYNIFNHVATIKQRNYFKLGDEIEFFGPKIKNHRHVIEEIIDDKGMNIECANHPEQIVKIKVNCRLHKDDMIRMINVK